MFKSIKRWYSRPSNPAGNVYYARLKTPHGTFYKLGYTAKSSLQERLAYSGHGDEKFIDREFIFSFRADAWDVEQTLLEHFERQRAFGKFSNDPLKPLPGRGQSELFAQDILGLDDELYAKAEAEAQATLHAQQSTESTGCLAVVIGLIGLALAPFTLGISLIFLVLILGGWSDIFSSRPTVPTASTSRPLHPRKIGLLIDELRTGGPLR